MFAPRAAKACAICSPIPRLPPVIRTVLPVNSVDAVSVMVPLVVGGEWLSGGRERPAGLEWVHPDRKQRGDRHGDPVLDVARDVLAAHTRRAVHDQPSANLVPDRPPPS